VYWITEIIIRGSSPHSKKHFPFDEKQWGDVKRAWKRAEHVTDLGTCRRPSANCWLVGAAARRQLVVLQRTVCFTPRQGIPRLCDFAIPPFRACLLLPLTSFVFENKVLTRIWGTKKLEITTKCVQLRNTDYRVRMLVRKICCEYMKRNTLTCHCI
jgi:hypothetical protein